MSPNISAEANDGRTPPDASAPSPHSAQAAQSRLNALLALCVEADSSDLHLAPELPPYLRLEGVLQPIADFESLTAAEIETIAAHLAKASGRTPLSGAGSLDGAVSGPDGTRFRFNIFRRQGALAVAIRRLEDRFRGLAELGLPESLYRLCDLPDGLVLVAGPTGSGKSTTLATLLHRINQTRRCHMVTIEDPIEYLHESQMALVNQRQIGGDANDFAEAVVASLRQDPDVILIGEIRDLATIRTAITAAETGHLVFTTVHAGDCVGAIERVVAVFPADEQAGMRRQLSMVLRAVVAQHLLVADGPAQNAPRNGSPTSEQEASGGIPRRSRVVTSEILFSTPAVANLIATEKAGQIYSAMESGSASGMQTLEQDLARLMIAGRISETSAMAMARSPNVLRERANRLRNGAGPSGRSTGALR